MQNIVKQFFLGNIFAAHTHSGFTYLCIYIHIFGNYVQYIYHI